MFFRFRVLHIALITLIALLCLPQLRTIFRAAPAGQYNSRVEIPTSGNIDERPFFSTRRHPAIAYSDSPTTDAAGELQRKVDGGAVNLKFEGRGGFLNSVLNELHVSPTTQSIVFSKTSLQAHYISPSNPRAIFYSDNISVAFIPGAPLLEIAALDPKQGVVFYAISQQEDGKIYRSDSCLSCHEARDSMGVPGYLARSVGSGMEGETLSDFGDYVSDHRSPFEQRWGGWFITGKAGSVHHMGNVLLKADAVPGRAYSVPQSLASLDGKFNLDGYPSHYSDVAAVLVLDHQVKMTNLLTRVGWEARIAKDQADKNPEDKAKADEIVRSDVRALVDYMLFVDEAPLEGKFESTSGFQAKFSSEGVMDRMGRSLKQLDLGKRLMKYPCSYMIYSPAFDGLPTTVRDAVYARMWEVLSGKDTARKYSKLTAADRSAVIDILRETKSNLPAYFKALK